MLWLGRDRVLSWRGAGSGWWRRFENAIDVDVLLARPAVDILVVYRCAVGEEASGVWGFDRLRMAMAMWTILGVSNGVFLFNVTDTTGLIWSLGFLIYLPRMW